MWRISTNSSTISHPPPWSKEQIWGLAPDTNMIRISSGMATPEKWQLLAHGSFNTNQFVWGVTLTFKKKPLYTLISLNDETAVCSCKSHKFPCRHSLGLLLLFHENPAVFTDAKPNKWITEQQKRHQYSQKRRQQQSATNMSATKPLLANNHDHHLQRVMGGVAELELWLRDMVRHGLATLPDRPNRYWVEIADRMVDAEAPLIAKKLRQMSRIPLKNADWPQQYLQQIGQLFLLTQGFKQWKTLPIETQSDLKMAVGWLPNPLTHAGEMVEDKWLIMGRTRQPINKQQWQHTWLWGINCNRLAMITQTILPNKPNGRFHPTGSTLNGTLHFSPSHTPLLADGVNLVIDNLSTHHTVGFSSIERAMQTFTQAQTANPWLSEFPIALKSVQLLRQEQERLLLIDQAGHILPLTKPFNYSWHLDAFSNQQPFSLFGIWQNGLLKPITFLAPRGWLDLHVLRGVR